MSDKVKKIKEEMKELSQTSEFGIKLSGMILTYLRDLDQDDKLAMQNLQLKVAQIIDIALEEDKKSVIIRP